MPEQIPFFGGVCALCWSARAAEDHWRTFLSDVYMRCFLNEHGDPTTPVLHITTRSASGKAMVIIERVLKRGKTNRSVIAKAMLKALERAPGRCSSQIGDGMEVIYKWRRMMRDAIKATCATLEEQESKPVVKAVVRKLKPKPGQLSLFDTPGE